MPNRDSKMPANPRAHPADRLSYDPVHAA